MVRVKRLDGLWSPNGPTILWSESREHEQVENHFGEYIALSKKRRLPFHHPQLQFKEDI